MIDQTLHEKIEAYLFGQMPPDEAAAFKQQIADDPKLAEDVELHRLVLPIYETLEEMEMHKKFKKWRAEMEAEAERPPSMFDRFDKKSIFTGIALLGLFFFLCWFYFKKPGTGTTSNNPAIEEQTGTTNKNQQIQNNLPDDTTTNKPLINAINNQINLAVDSTLKKPKRPSHKKKPIYIAKFHEQADKINSLQYQYDPEYVQLAGESLDDYAYEISQTFRSLGNNSDLPGEVLIRKADTAMIDKNYKEAIRQLMQVSPLDSIYYSKSLEFLAYAQFKNNQYEAAIETYKKYCTFNRDTDKTDWDMCRFYLPVYSKYKNELNALLAKIIGDAEHPKYTQAVELKGKLEKK